MTKSKFSLWNSGWDKRITLSIKLKMVLFYAQKDVGSGNLKNGPKKLVCNTNWNIHDHPF